MYSLTTRPDASFSAAGTLPEIVRDVHTAPVHRVFGSILSAGDESSATADATDVNTPG